MAVWEAVGEVGEGVTFLVYERGKRARAWCAECRVSHGKRKCPKAVDWKAVERAADEMYARVKAYWESRRTKGA